MQLTVVGQRRAARRRSSPPVAPPRSHHRVPWPQQQCMQMGPTMTSCDVCRAAGWALGPRGVASGSFASANILLKSFVEQKGALSTIERCTGASRNACAHCLRLTRACQGPLPSALIVPPALSTTALASPAQVPSPASNSRLELRLYECCCSRARSPSTLAASHRRCGSAPVRAALDAAALDAAGDGTARCVSAGMLPPCVRRTVERRRVRACCRDMGATSAACGSEAAATVHGGCEAVPMVGSGHAVTANSARARPWLRPGRSHA